MAVTYTENGTNTPNGSHLEFSYTFPTVKTDGTDVNVSLDGQTQATSKYTVDTTSSPTKITFNNTSINSLLQESTGAPKTGVIVRVYRNTLLENADGVTYVAGSSIRAQDLNSNYDQLRYALQEEKNTLLQEENVTDLAITRAKIANDAIDSTKLADNSVGSSELQSDSVGNTQIKDNAVTAAKIAADAVGSAQIADGAVGASEIAADAVRSAQIQDGAVGSSEIAANAVGSAQIADGAVGSSEIAADAVGAAQIADGAVGSAALAADSVGSAQIADGAVGASEIAADAVRSAQIQDGAVGSSEIAADAIQNAQLADNSVAAANIAANAVGSAQIADGAVGSSELDANSVGNVQMKDNAITMTEIGCEETTITDDDTKLPTSGAVVDYVNTQIAAVGGFDIITNRTSFPNTPPAAGVAVSITDASGIVFDSTSTPDTTTGNCTEVDGTNVTIQAAPDALQGKTIGAGVGMLVSYSGSGTNYTFHRLLAKDSDVEELSQDIQDFKARYRVASSAPGSNNDEGDLYFDTGANKMYVYDGSTWGQVTSTGEFKILGVKDNGQAHNGTGPTFNGSNDQYDLFEGTSDASVNQAAQLTVVLNGVVQKPNDGSFDGSEEGFYLDGADGIRFCDPPPSGSTLFVIKSGSATEIAVPADNSVTAGKTDISLVQGDIIYSNGTDSWTRLAKGTAGQVLKMNSGATAPEWGTDFIIADDSITEVKLDVSNAPTNGQFLQAQSGEGGGLTWATVSAGITSDAQDNTVGGTNAGDSFTGTDAEKNTLFGKDAGTAITTADSTTAIGSEAGVAINTGSYNTCVGDEAGKALTTSTYGTYIGYRAGKTYSTENQFGASTICIGAQSGENATGVKNTILGTKAGQSMGSANNCVLIGNETAKSRTGNYNVAIGSGALPQTGAGANNVVLGFYGGGALTSGGNNVFLGYDAGSNGTTGSNNICIGYESDLSAADVSNEITLGDTAITKFRVPGINFTLSDMTGATEITGNVKLNGHSESIVTALTSASSVTIDFSLSNHFSCTMGHNITFANPSTESVGQSGTIVLTQDGTGSRTASWGSQFLWAGGTAPTLSTAANAVDRIDYFVAAADKIHCVISLAMA